MKLSSATNPQDAEEQNQINSLVHRHHYCQWFLTIVLMRLTGPPQIWIFLIQSLVSFLCLPEARGDLWKHEEILLNCAGTSRFLVCRWAACDSFTHQLWATVEIWPQTVFCEFISQSCSLKMDGLCYHIHNIFSVNLRPNFVLSDVCFSPAPRLI